MCRCLGKAEANKNSLQIIKSKVRSTRPSSAVYSSLNSPLFNMDNFTKSTAVPLVHGR